MFIIFISLLFFFIVSPQPVHAYLDPGNGSYILQMGIGLLLGIIASIKVFYKDISSFIAKKFQLKKANNTPASTTNEHSISE